MSPLLVSISLLIVPGAFCLRKDSVRFESQYASSLFRRNQVLEDVPLIETIENVTAVSVCLLSCMQRKADCKAFNWGPNQCQLMSDSVCANESLVLTPKPGFSYYDIMDSPDFEKKHLKDLYCRQRGKCSGRCYPRKPHYVDTALSWTDAHKYCHDLGRALPQPRSSDENLFYANFIKRLLVEKPEIRNQKDMKFWFGMSDTEVEGVWLYVDSTAVDDSFTAWALGQPDNGGPFGSGRENCAAIGERADFKWLDVSCNLKLKFFCA